MQFGRVTLDMDARQLLEDDGEVVALTAMEFDLLNAFAQNPNRCCRVTDCSILRIIAVRAI
jgi:two-component system phosphate regulon response regulator OmpR